MICISMTADKAKMTDEIKRQVDAGATLIYSHGGDTDQFMMAGGKIDAIAQMVELIKAQGLPAGVGGHSLNMPVACEQNKVNADFYVKTFHMDRYWSATPKERRKEYDWMQTERGRPRRQQRRHVVQQPGGDGGLHGDGREALGGVQGDGGGGDPAGDGVSLRLSPRGGLRDRGDVRLPGRARRADRHRKPAKAQRPQAAVERVSGAGSVRKGKGKRGKEGKKGKTEV